MNSLVMISQDLPSQKPGTLQSKSIEAELTPFEISSLRQDLQNSAEQAKSILKKRIKKINM